MSSGNRRNCSWSERKHDHRHRTTVQPRYRAPKPLLCSCCSSQAARVDFRAHTLRPILKVGIRPVKMRCRVCRGRMPRKREIAIAPYSKSALVGALITEISFSRVFPAWSGCEAVSLCDNRRFIKGLIVTGEGRRFWRLGTHFCACYQCVRQRTV